MNKYILFLHSALIEVLNECIKQDSSNNIGKITWLNHHDTYKCDIIMHCSSIIYKIVNTKQQNIYTLVNHKSTNRGVGCKTIVTRYIIIRPL